MIRKLQINNYKSLHELTLEVGRFNVLIGENGCGKSNLLEAVALAGAAAANKLDHEFLASRGIRVTEPQLMRSGFEQNAQKEPVKIAIESTNDVSEEYYFYNDNEPYSTWKVYPSEEAYDLIREAPWELIEDNVVQQVKTSSSMDKKSFTNFDRDNFETLFKDMLERFVSKGVVIESKIEKFIIYSPENTALRNFYKEGQIEPLGINGEGLLKLLKVIQSKSPEQRQDIHTSLQLFDWYAELDIPTDLSPSEDKVTITDRYLTLAFDQRSANEGFLFVLFYIALMVSDDTPKIFAIDNIDTSLNPKLCTKLIKELARLAKKYDKQVFVTTHNPAILDGIDLGDGEQRLLVLSRNKQGHTRYKRITLEDKPRSSTNEDLKLSEAFLRGYLGGLPKGF
jgi:predicted ATPase